MKTRNQNIALTSSLGGSLFHWLGDGLMCIWNDELESVPEWTSDLKLIKEFLPRFLLSKSEQVSFNRLGKKETAKSYVKALLKVKKMWRRN